MSVIAIEDRRQGLRDRFLSLNWLLLGMLTVIASVGVATLYSVAEGSWSPYAGQHVLRYGVSVLLLIAVGLTPLRVWLQLAYPAYFGALVLLLLVPLIGETNMGAQRWIALPGFQLQPSEVMKVALVLALARYYHGLEFKRVSSILGIAPPLVMIGAPVGLVFLQPDLGTAILIALSGLVMMILAGLSWRWMVAGAITAFFGVVGAIQTGLLKQYQIDRLTAFLNPDFDPLGANYHPNQSKIAIGSGGVDGKGYMEGTQSQLGFLPEMHTDFIFTIFGEEFGLIGTLGLLGLYFGTFLVAMNVALRAKSHFGRLLVMGVALTFMMYVLINTGMVMGLAPVVGVPLPLVSYGGTVMVSMMGAFGLVMSVWIWRNQDTLRTS
jgi:rod shape determining protein RodA